MRFAILISDIWLNQVNHINFFFSKITKSWKKGRTPPTLELKKFSQDSSVCVVNCLDEYLRRSGSWRVKVQLLLSHLCHHDKVKPSTIARWVKVMLEGQESI